MANLPFNLPQVMFFHFDKKLVKIGQNNLKMKLFVLKWLYLNEKGRKNQYSWGSRFTLGISHGIAQYWAGLYLYSLNILALALTLYCLCWKQDHCLLNKFADYTVSENVWWASLWKQWSFRQNNIFYFWNTEKLPAIFSKIAPCCRIAILLWSIVHFYTP